MGVEAERGSRVVQTSRQPWLTRGLARSGGERGGYVFPPTCVHLMSLLLLEAEGAGVGRSVGPSPGLVTPFL